MGNLYWLALPPVLLYRIKSGAGKRQIFHLIYSRSDIYIQTQSTWHPSSQLCTCPAVPSSLPSPIPSVPPTSSSETKYSLRNHTRIPHHAGPLKHQRPLHNPPPNPLDQRQHIRIQPVQIQHLARVRALAEQARLEIRRAVGGRAVIDADHRRAEQVLRVDLGNRRREPGLDRGQAAQVRQRARVVCRRARGEDGAQQAEVFGVDGQRVRVERLVDLLPGREGGGGGARGRAGGGDGGQ